MKTFEYPLTGLTRHPCYECAFYYPGDIELRSYIFRCDNPFRWEPRHHYEEFRIDIVDGKRIASLEKK